MRAKKILIATATHYCGGTIVLAQLCRSLTEMGYDARIYPVLYYPTSESQSIRFYGMCIRSFFARAARRILFGEKDKMPRHFAGCKVKKTPFYCKKNTIVVYPELVYGNPLHSKRTVRWLLFHYRYSNDDKAFSPDDMFMGFRDFFNRGVNVFGENVKCSHFDSDLYKQTNYGRREGNCYFVRKGYVRSDLPKSFDGPVLDNLSEEEKVEVLNKCKYCYSYDTQTFYSTIAAVCGCISIIVTEPGKEVSDYGTEEDKRYGVAVGNTPDQLKRAEETRNILLESLNFEERNKKAAQTFIENVESFFNIEMKMRNGRES